MLSPLTNVMGFRAPIFMKKSVEILGLPIISITEGFELGISKTLLINAKNGTIAAITIEDEDWYRGVKLLPYSSVIAIGDDAITITSSDDILTLEEAGDYEAMLNANIRIIGTKAITMSGTIQGKVSEIFVDENGKIEKCEIKAADDSISEITYEQVSIFGKQVTVVKAETAEKKNDYLTSILQNAASRASKSEVKPEAPAFEPDIKEEFKIEPETITEDDIFVAEPAVEEVATPVVSVITPVDVPTAVKSVPEKNITPVVKNTTAAETVSKSTLSHKSERRVKTTAITDRHRRFLVGKTVTRRIVGADGTVIVEKGAVITEEDLQKASVANKLIELTMNVQ